MSKALARVQSVDLLRGAACVLMAIDHVRVYSGVPAGGPEPTVFLTRWVTHFVAPMFCFFAGTAAWFHGRQLGDVRALRRFLVGRGLLLVLLELTVIRFLWAFEVGPSFVLAGVIWMLGWCMVLLAPFAGMRGGRAAAIGVAIIVGQQAFALVPRLLPATAREPFGVFWNFIYPAGTEPWPAVQILYVLVPWVGVMLAGYGIGALWDREPTDRDRLFVRLGVAMTVAFVMVAGVLAWVDAPSTNGDAAPFWMRLLDQRKYPASQLFLLMTLGPAIALLPWAERARGWAAHALTTIGRVPMFYYLAHILVIHLLAIATMRLLFGEFQHEWYATAPYTWLPDNRWSLTTLYVVFALAIAVLYPLCAVYARRKATRPARWMRYL